MDGWREEGDSQEKRRGAECYPRQRDSPELSTEAGRLCECTALQAGASSVVKVELSRSWAGVGPTGPSGELAPHSKGEGLSSSAARLLPQRAPIPVWRQDLGPWCCGQMWAPNITPLPSSLSLPLSPSTFPITATRKVSTSYVNLYCHSTVEPW